MARRLDLGLLNIGPVTPGPIVSKDEAFDKPHMVAKSNEFSSIKHTQILRIESSSYQHQHSETSIVRIEDERVTPQSAEGNKEEQANERPVLPNLQTDLFLE